MCLVLFEVIVCFYYWPVLGTKYSILLKWIPVFLMVLSPIINHEHLDCIVLLIIKSELICSKLCMDLP